MALTKLPKNAIGTASIDDTKIEDGTIQNAELAGSLSEDKFATGTIANAKLSNSTITVRGTSRALGDSFSLQVDVEWQSVQTGDFTASAGKGYFINTTSAVVEVTLPSSASIGDTIAIKDYAGTFATNNLTIARNGHNIQGVANNNLIPSARAGLTLVYVDATRGWVYSKESNVADLQTPLFTQATGGTVATSGDFKIHSFTGDGCFVVSQSGNSPAVPTGGPGNVDYLVVAGGGGGDNGNSNRAAAGGGGAGGYRTSFPSPAGVISVSAQTYPITVGGGGAGGSAVNGSPSVFSTITSAGGGYGFGGCNLPTPAGGPGGGDGGSGGGGDYAPNGTAGAGNTPPVSPPQGNPGGNGNYGPAPEGPPSTYPAGGGGGASAAGGDGPGPGSIGGAGGAGAPNAITGTAVSYAGGGGGGVGRADNDTHPNPDATKDAGPGGAGGGGNGSTGGTGTNAVAGTANLGGGGGGGSAGNQPSPLKAGGAGGSGIVIIRYKFQ